MRVSAAARRYLAEGQNRGQFEATTVKTYRSILAAFTQATGDPELDRLSRRHVARWYGSLRCSPSTTRHRLSVIQTFCGWLVLNGWTKTDPSVGFKPPAQPRYLPRHMPSGDVGRLLAVAPDTRARLVVLLMAQMGLRCCEVSRAQLGDLDLSDNVMVVHGKGRKQRVVPIPAEARAAIDAYLSEQPANAGPLVRSYHDPTRALTPGYLGDRMRRWMLAAGVKSAARDGRSAHALRHTCATDVLAAGASVRQVQEMLGHGSLATTQRYLGVRVDDLRAPMEGRRYAL